MNQILNSTIAILVAVLYFNHTAAAQQISAIQIQGDSYVEEQSADRTMYKKIVYGPLPATEVILIKEDAALVLLNSKDEVCNLTKEGSYKVADLVFTKPKANSVFSKFCNYFHSFFVSHSSAESKANYKNSIYAISRGKQSPPALDFPLEGLLPSGVSTIPFYWSHACDSCEYIVTLNKLDSKANVYAWTTQEHTVTLQDADKYLEVGQSYYWSVSVSGLTTEPNVAILDVESESNYNQSISHLNDDAKDVGIESLELSTLYVMSALEADGLTNHSLLYGLHKVEQHPANEQLANFVERLWYDGLME